MAYNPELLKQMLGTLTPGELKRQLAGCTDQMAKAHSLMMSIISGRSSGCGTGKSPGSYDTSSAMKVRIALPSTFTLKSPSEPSSESAPQTIDWSITKMEIAPIAGGKISGT